jgi:hypothetical protein
MTIGDGVKGAWIDRHLVHIFVLSFLSLRHIITP